MHGVVTGARRHVHAGKSERRRLRAHQIDDARIEHGRRHVGDAFDRDRARARGGLRHARDPVAQARDRARVGMAEIDGEMHVPRHGIGRAGLALEPADGEAHHVGGIVHVPLQRRDDGDRTLQRVLAHAQRGRARMRFLARHVDGVTLRALDAGDHADRLALGLQPGALLDMRLDIGVEAPVEPIDLAHRRRGERFLQRVGQDDARPVRDREHLGEIVVPGPCGRPHRAGLEAAAFFVHPGHDLYRPLSAHARVVERFERLEPGEHAVNAVVLAPGGLAVHMRAGDDGRRVVLGARTAHVEISDRIAEYVVAARGGPLAQQAPRGCVLGRQRLTVHPAFGQSAELGHFDMALPKTGFVDTGGGL